MREKLFSVGGDSRIENHAGERAFKVEGKALRLRDTMEVERDGDDVAEVFERWFRVRDTYGDEIAPGQDDALILAVVVCIDQMSHD